MHIPAFSEDEVTAFLKPLGCTVRFLKPGLAAGYVDERGEHKQVTINEYSQVTEGGHRREAESKLLNAIAEDAGNAVTVFVRGAWSQAVVSEQGPEVFLTYELGFGRHAEDVRKRPAHMAALESKAQVDFGVVIAALKSGLRAARVGWNGANMSIYLVPASSFTANRQPLTGIFGEGAAVEYRAHSDMIAADGHCVAWTVSQSDALADDWLILPRLK